MFPEKTRGINSFSVTDMHVMSSMYVPLQHHEYVLFWYKRTLKLRKNKQFCFLVWAWVSRREVRHSDNFEVTKVYILFTISVFPRASIDNRCRLFNPSFKPPIIYCWAIVSFKYYFVQIWYIEQILTVLFTVIIYCFTIFS